MTSLPGKEIFSSPPFTFLVGSAQKQYTIHSALVAQQSKALHALVHGQMKEATDLCVKWDETDEDTFIRFSQYVYSRTYYEPSPSKRPITDAAPSSSPDAAPASNQEDELNGQSTHRKIASRGRKSHKADPADAAASFADFSKKDALWDSFSRLYPISRIKNEPPGNAPDDDCSSIFLCHARLYVLADYYGINALQTLALHNLRRSLERFQLYSQGYCDIIGLLKFSFTNTMDKGEQADPLRSLVCHYVACKVEELWQDDAFKDLIGALPEFSASLLSVLLNRLD